METAQHQKSKNTKLAYLLSACVFIAQGVYVVVYPGYFAEILELETLYIQGYGVFLLLSAFMFVFFAMKNTGQSGV